ncbi:MAG: glycosyltransferase family 4 protein [Clostridiaceae bacterium]|nr:glycosyltransferase family 4 protein [Clostridiaceae bacterium]
MYILVHELAERGHDVTVFAARSPKHNQLSEIDGLSVRRVSKEISLYNSYLPLSLLRRFDPSEFDLIHAHTPVPAIADIIALKNITARTPFILTYHNDITKSGFLGGIISSIYNMTLGKSLVKNSDIIITTTQSYASNSKLLKSSLSKVRVIPNGVDCDLFKPGLDTIFAREKYGINPSDKLILFVGHLDHYKGCEYLIRALPLIAEKIEHAHLLIVGSGPQSAFLRQIAATLHIEDKITFAGYVEDHELPYIYASADVFVLPSISSYEGFGIVQLEALSSGKPVVTTMLPGVRDVDSQGIASLHVQPKDPVALSGAIITLLKNIERSREMGRKGRSLVLERYSWPKVIEEIEKLYFMLRGDSS